MYLSSPAVLSLAARSGADSKLCTERIDDTIITPHEPTESRAGSTISSSAADDINAKESTCPQTDPSNGRHNSRVKKVPIKYSDYDLIRNY